MLCVLITHETHKLVAAWLKDRATVGLPVEQIKHQLNQAQLAKSGHCVHLFPGENASEGFFPPRFIVLLDWEADCTTEAATITVEKYSEWASPS